jgi:hypothetical protein
VAANEWLCRILAAMRKGASLSLALVAVVGLTVALLAVQTPSASRCASGRTARGTRVTTLIPPGNSSVSQYVETVPTARGGCPSGAIQLSAGGASIPRFTERSLLASGTDGAATAALARETSPVGSALNAPGLPVASGNHEVNGRGPMGGSSGGTSPLGAEADALGGSSGGSGLGALFPILLIMCLLGAGGAFFLRRRQRGG